METGPSLSSQSVRTSQSPRGHSSHLSYSSSPPSFSASSNTPPPHSPILRVPAFPHLWAFALGGFPTRNTLPVCSWLRPVLSGSRAWSSVGLRGNHPGGRSRKSIFVWDAKPGRGLCEGEAWGQLYGGQCGCGGRRPAASGQRVVLLPLRATWPAGPRRD